MILKKLGRSTDYTFGRLVIFSNFEVAARPGFVTEFKNILHKCYLVIILTYLQESGDSKKIGEVYSQRILKIVFKINPEMAQRVYSWSNTT